MFWDKLCFLFLHVNIPGQRCSPCYEHPSAGGEEGQGGLTFLI